MLNLIPSYVDHKKITEKLKTTQDFFVGSTDNEFSNFVEYLDYIKAIENTRLSPLGYLMDFSKIDPAKVADTYLLLKNLQHLDNIYIFGDSLPFLYNKIDEDSIDKEFANAIELVNEMVAGLGKPLSINVIAKLDKIVRYDIIQFIVENFCNKILQSNFDYVFANKTILNFKSFVSNKSTLKYMVQYIYNRC